MSMECLVKASSQNVDLLPSFCDCYFPLRLNMVIRSPNDDLLEISKCRCGEGLSGCPRLDWKWMPDETADIKIQFNREVIFHPGYSSGTAFVRGDKPLESGMIHFWEMRVLTPLVGTDLMFGIGSSDIEFKDYAGIFVSGLGLNGFSWGLSFKGRIQYAGNKTRYGHRFQQGCIVGIYLDRVLGYIEFFLNRTSCGIAYTNIPVDPFYKLYPMACSTSAQSAIRLINATSVPDSLKFRAYQATTKVPAHLRELQGMKGFRHLHQDFWFLAPPVRSTRQISDFDDIMDEAVVGNKTALQKSNTERANEDIDPEDLYTNADRDVMQEAANAGAAAHENESDEGEHDAHMVEYFDEYLAVPY